MTTKAYFTSALFKYLRDLAANNDRDWFQARKERYERLLRDPAQRFISDFGPRLAKISPHFLADPRPVGGSLFRIFRDVRFSKDKSPYKTHVGIQFRHKEGRDAHAPGYYLHLEPGGSFAGMGLWHPDGATVKKIREQLVADPGGWKKAVGSKSFRQRFALEGDKLKRPPRGFDAEHPLIEDLKRKDFIAVTRFTQKEVTSADFLTRFTAVCRSGSPLMRYLCAAVDVPF